MSVWPLLLKISKTHLLARKKQSVIAALGVTFGIGTFIILVSFMTGLNGLLDGLILNRTPHIHIYNEIVPSEVQPIERLPAFQQNFNLINSVKPKTSQMKVHNALPIVNYLRQLPEIRGVAPTVKAQVFYNAGSITLNGVLNGIIVNQETKLFDFGNYIVKGRPENLNLNENGILIGSGVAKKLSLEMGKKVLITSPSGNIFPLTIVGVFQSGLADIDKVQSYINLKTAQKILGEGSGFISDINLKLYDVSKSVDLAEKLGKQFNVAATDIYKANAQFETGTSIRNLITYAVSITLLVVAGFGIYNILNMMIYEKMNDIAILKAIGFSGNDVKKIFISQAILIGLVGAVAGLLMGYGVSVLISHTPFNTEALPTVKTFPVVFAPKYYLIGLVFALVSTFLAGYLPAKKAEKIDPVDIIRGQ